MHFWPRSATFRTKALRPIDILVRLQNSLALQLLRLSESPSSDRIADDDERSRQQMHLAVRQC